MAGITISPDSGTQFEAGAAEYNSVARLDDNHFVVAYRDNNDGNKGKVNVGSRTGTSITINEANAVTFNNNSTDIITVRMLSTSLILISYRDVNSGKPYVIAGSISGTTITLGTPVNVKDVSTVDGVGLAILDGTNFVVSITYYIPFNSHTYSFVGSISGTTITLGAEVNVGSQGSYCNSIGLDGTHFAVLYQYGGEPSYLYSKVGTVNVGDKTITFGSEATLTNSMASAIPCISNFDSTHFIVGYKVGATYTDLNIVVCSVNLTTDAITVGAAIVTGTNTTDKSNYSLCAINASSFLCSYYTTTGTQAEIMGGTLTGDTSITWNAQGAVVFDNDVCAYTALCRLTDDHFLLGYKEEE
jgi:hypothetical protein